MRNRLVIIPIDDCTRILADYAGKIGFPPDAQPVKWMFEPAEQKMALVVEADSLTADAPPERIHFTLKHTFLVGGA